MSTGSEFVSITNKKLMGYEDFDMLFLRYLQDSVFDSVSRLFEQGTFTEKMPLSSPGADQVQIDLKPTAGDGYCHDGQGHMLDLEQVTRVAQFENSVGVTYEVGADYIEVPKEIRINPNTGGPEYDRFVEGVGVEANPDSVTDNGTNITFRVDSLFEQGVAVADHTGRLVRVFMKVPAEGGLTEAVAIETATVFFSGGQNQITTSGVLGQSSVSTTASDYTVQLVGIIVLKDTATNRPTQLPDEIWFAGTVLGNGGTPTVFDILGQNVIEAGGAASVTFNPFTGAAPISWNIAATDVQAAIEEVVADLTSLTGGASLIRVDGSSFTQKEPSTSASWGGLGTTGNEVQVKLLHTDDQLVKSRHGITHSEDRLVVDADVEGVEDIITGFYDETHLLKGATAIEFDGTNPDMDRDGIPVVIGESMNKTGLRSPDIANFNFFGIFKDLQFSSQSYAPKFGAYGFFIADRCVVAPNAFTLQSGISTASGPIGAFDHLQPAIMRDCYMPPSLSGSGTPLSEAAFISTFVAAGGVQLIENCVFDSGSAGPVFKHKVAAMVLRESIVVYHKCIFRQTRNTDPCVEIDGENAVFIDCTFIKESTDDNNATVYINDTTEYVIFERCKFYSANGNIVYGESTGSPEAYRAWFKQCLFTSSTSASTGSTTPQAIVGRYLRFSDCEIRTSVSSVRTSGADREIIDLDVCTLDRVFFIQTGLTNLHNYSNWRFNSCNLNDCGISLPNNELANAMGGTNPAMIQFDQCKIKQLSVSGTMNMPESQTLANFCVVRLDEFCTIDGFVFAVSTTASTATSIGYLGYIRMDGQGNLINDIVANYSTGNAPQLATGRAYIEINGNDGGLHKLNISDDSVAFTFNASTASYYLILINAHNVSVHDCVSSATAALAAEVDFITITGGQFISIKNNKFQMLGNASSSRRFVYNAATVQDAWYILVESNIFSWRAGTASPAADRWIDLSSVGGDAGERSIVDNNLLLNGNAIPPVITNGGTGAITGDNVATASLSFYA